MLLHYVFRLFCNLAFFVCRVDRKIYGSENMIQEGSHLIVVNHMSFLDSFLVLVSLPPRRIRFMIGEKWENLPIGGKLAKGLGGIFVNRYAVDRKAIKETLHLLKNGEPLGMAPEGQRSAIGQVIRPKNGASYLAHKTNVQIVPVGIMRTEQFSRNLKKYRKTCVEMHIGEPITLPTLNGKVRQKELTAYSDYIMLHILRQLPEKYHGYYRMVKHPGLPTILQGNDPWEDCLQFNGIDLNRIPTE